MSDDTLRTIIYIIVVILAPINVYVTYRLLSLSHKYDGKIGALSERATMAVMLCAGSIAGAILSLAWLSGNTVPPTVSIFLNGVAAFVLSFPALYWYIKYRTGGFREDG